MMIGSLIFLELFGEGGRGGSVWVWCAMWND